MILKTIRFFVLSVFCLSCLQASAQDDYRAEIGVTGGGDYYLGDVNSQFFKNTQLTYGAFFRYRINPRIALKGEWNSAKISGYYSTISLQNIAFSNQINAFDFCGEFNFFDLEQNPNKRLSKKFSPYIFGGFGLMSYSYDNGQSFKPSIPFGLGFKLKLAKRWNLNAQWSTRILMSDQMEGIATLNNANDLNGSNFTNNDLLSTFTVGLSYDIWKKQCDCNNNSYIKVRKRK